MSPRRRERTVPSEPAAVEVTVGVERHRVAVGSKSDRTAVVAEINGRMVTLRRRGTAAFGADAAALDSLVGNTVRLRGRLLGTVFLVEDVLEVVPPKV